MALGLGACSTDSSQRTSGPGSGPTRPLSPAADTKALPPDTITREQARRPVPLKAVVAEPPVRTRPKRGSNTMADVEEELIDSLALVDVPWNSEEGEARRAELQQFLATGLPPAQSFAIRPGRDTLVLGRQGTQLLIPANAWDLPAGSPPVQLEVREFYDPIDMMLAGLSTTSGPRLLESGGMLHLKATANGQPVQLRPGAYVHLRMPAPAVQPGMQLFEGVVADSTHGGIDWQLPRPTAADADQRGVSPSRYRSFRGRRGGARKSKRRRRPKPAEGQEVIAPEYVRGEKGFRKDLTTLIDYPEATRRRLRRGRRISKAEHMVLRAAANEAKEWVLRVVGVVYTVDSTGTTTAPQLSAGTDPELAATITNAIKQLPPWEPGWASSLAQPDSLEALTVSRRISIFFTESGKVIVEPREWELVIARTRHNRTHQARLWAERRERMRLADSLYAARRGYYDSLSALQQARVRAELVRMRTQFTDTSKAAITAAGVYNELSAQGLSWINCDRYLGPGPLITYGVNTGSSGAVVTLLFRGFNSVMQGREESAARTIFPNVPVGRTATVVALRRANGVTYLSTRNTIIGPLALGGFRFRPVTMPELRAELARLR
ncbi:hypothetical protein GCM10023185_04630 [Hymenobacter saemangeumensis]|uniref:Uncharacterized protein n=2 Tax=Hymenobacter saemangeumensis TaxID=1084522 RepID=A0ABP8I083_9BACT